MKNSKLYQANPVVSYREEEGGTLLFNPDSNELALINTTGKMIWELISVPHTFKQVETYLADNMDSFPADQITQDLEQFLKVLTPDFILEVISSEPINSH